MKLYELMQKPDREEIDMDEYIRRQKAKLKPKPKAVVPRKNKRGYAKSHTYASDGKHEYSSSDMKGRNIDVREGFKAFLSA